jgi:hypothetical protein
MSVHQLSEKIALGCLGLALFAGAGESCCAAGTAATAVTAQQDTPPGWRYWGSRLSFEEARKAADSLEGMGFETLIQAGDLRYYIYYR